jgi:hypothetical protein
LSGVSHLVPPTKRSVFLDLVPSGLSTSYHPARVVVGRDGAVGLVGVTGLPESNHLVCVMSGVGGAERRTLPVFGEAGVAGRGAGPLGRKRSRADWPRTADPTCEDPILVASSIRYPCVSKGLSILPNCSALLSVGFVPLGAAVGARSAIHTPAMPTQSIRPDSPIRVGRGVARIFPRIWKITPIPPKKRFASRARP